MRLEITRKSNLAINVMAELAEDGGRVSGKKLADRVGTTTAFLAQVVTALVQKGWVSSQPGRAGGYELTVDPHTVSVLDMIEAVEGSTDTDTCVLRLGMCSAAEPCATHDAWSRARDALVSELSETSLALLSPVRSSR
jgi:Rrf2 family protein